MLYMNYEDFIITVIKLKKVWKLRYTLDYIYLYEYENTSILQFYVYKNNSSKMYYTCRILYTIIYYNI